MGAKATKKWKRIAEEEAEAIVAQKAKAITVQDKYNKQFTQDVEAIMARRDKGKRKAQETPTPTVRSKRVIKKTVWWEPPKKQPVAFLVFALVIFYVISSIYIYSYNRSPSNI